MQDVNYPTNMLYAARLQGDPARVALEWRRHEGVREYTLTLPAGFTAAVENRSSDRLVEVASREPAMKALPAKRSE